MNKFLTRFRIGPRLAAAFLVLLLGVVAVGLNSRFNIAYLVEQLQAIKAERVPKVQQLVQIVDNTNRIAVNARNLLIFDDSQRQTGWIASIQKIKGENASLLASVKPGIHSEEGRQLVAQVETALKGVDKDLDAFLAHMQGGEVSVAQELMDKQMAASLQTLFTALDALKGREIDRIGKAADAAIARSATLRAFGLALILTLVAAGLVFAWLISRSIVTPMRRALREAHRIAGGDLSAEMTVRGQDEAADMLKALMAMQQGLRGIVSEVREGVASVATASAQIASGNQDLSGRTEEQASSLQQTAASIEQISGAVKTNAHSADTASALAQAASGAAGRGGKLVGEAVQRIAELEASSQRIAEIVGVIDGIAFQTNILALNAAVEAARAGEQGRGFAVVAGEVRALAQRSAEAAKEIKTLVTGSVEQIQISSATARRAGEAMGEIVTQVKGVSGLVNEICGASREQDRGVDAIHQAMSSLDDMTQRNAALVEEGSAAAESLKAQAARLAETVASFRLERDAQPA